MTKAQLQKRVVELEGQVKQLQDDLVRIATSPSPIQVIPIPMPAPAPQPPAPLIVPHPTTIPYTVPNYPIITCGKHTTQMPGGVIPLTFGDCVAPLTVDGLRMVDFRGVSASSIQTMECMSYNTTGCASSLQ